MPNVDLFKKILSGYQALLNQGESIPLSRYCKTHHVNYPSLLYWMKKQGLNPFKEKRSGGLVSSCIPAKGCKKPAQVPRELIPLRILSPEVVDDPGSPSVHLQGVSITLPKGMIVNIREISPVDLASLIRHIGQ